MGEGDRMPISRHTRKPDPEQVRKIREGGKKADEIRQKALRHHEVVDVPAAEEALEKALKEIEKQK